MSILSENLECLKKRFPYLLPLLEKKEDVRLTLCPNGTYVYNDKDGKCVHPYGEKDSDLLIKGWLKNLQLTSETCYPVSGFGTGKHIRALLEVLPQGCALFVMEPDVSFLYEVFSQVDCCDILMDERFALMIPDANGQSNFDILQAFELTHKTNITALIFTPLFVCNENLYYRYFTQFAQSFDVQKRMQNTMVYDAQNWEFNSLKNLHSIVNAPSLEVLKGRYKGLPLVLVAAGPSLDESIPFLKKVQDKAIIVSMNSSFRTLVKNHIHSHFTLAVDPRQTTFQGFEGVDPQDTYLITTYFVNPSVIDHFKNQFLTWDYPLQVCEYVFKNLHFKKGPYLNADGTVAAVVGDLAHFLGCQKVCLVGQDLAVLNNGQTHTSDSIYHDDNSLFMDTQDCRKCPGNTSNFVYVESKLYVYLKAFEELVKKHADIQFINTARLGAKIEGVPYFTYEEAEKWIGDNDACYISKELSSLIDNESKNPLDTVKKAIKPIKDFAEALCQKAFSWAVWHEHEGRPRDKHAKNLRKSYQSADAINAFIDTYEKEYQVLLGGKLIQSLFNFRKNLENVEAEKVEKFVVDWEQNREYYWALVDGCRNFLQQYWAAFE